MTTSCIQPRRTNYRAFETHELHVSGRGPTVLPIGAIIARDVARITWTPLTACVGTAPVASKLLLDLSILQFLNHMVIRWALAQLLYGDRSAVNPDVVAAFCDSIIDMPMARRLLSMGVRFKAELNRTCSHGGVGVPMTVIHGTAVRLVLVSASRSLHAANPDSRLVVLHCVGHCPQLDAADVVVSHACELVRHLTDGKEIL